MPEPHDSLRWLANFFAYMRGQILFYAQCKAKHVKDIDAEWWEKEESRLLVPIAQAPMHARNLGSILDYSYGSDAPQIKAKARNCAEDIKRYVFGNINQEKLNRRLDSHWSRILDDAEFLEVRLGSAEVREDAPNPSGLTLSDCRKHVNSRLGEASSSAMKVISALEKLIASEDEYIPRSALKAFGLPPTTLDHAALSYEGLKRGGHAAGVKHVEFRREKLIWWATYVWEPE